MPTKARNPKRVRARRAKNYKAVHRPTKWGNSFPISPTCSRAQAMAKYTLWLDDQLARDPAFLEPLRGYHLGCFCAPDERCHADIILDCLYRRAPRPAPAPAP